MNDFQQRLFDTIEQAGATPIDLPASRPRGKTQSKVDDARALAAKHSKTKVIILMIDDVAGTMEYASYGIDRQHCRAARRLADVAYDAIYDHLARDEP